MGCRKNEQTLLKKKLEDVDLNIDSGLGNDDLINSCLETIHQLQQLDSLESMERAQKVKIKWAVEGDENTGFFHGIINKRRNIQSIRGVMVEGKWIDNPVNVKKNFLIILLVGFVSRINLQPRFFWTFRIRYLTSNEHIWRVMSLIQKSRKRFGSVVLIKLRVPTVSRLDSLDVSGILWILKFSNM
ncbi:hypothetical protein Tco_1257808 [Tanacetum coccineum]